jgi:DNA-binding IclR family transcriptional regulator
MPTSDSPSPRPAGVPSLERALTVLECLAQSRKGYSVSELSRRFELPKSSVHLILRTFERRGYLYKQATGGRYRFGLKLVSLGRMALEGVEIRDEAKPILARLVRATGLTAHMGILERNEVVIIERLESASPIRVVSFVGRRMHVHSTAVGKALAAYLPESDLLGHMGDGPLPRANERTTVVVAEFRRELDRVREQGFALNDEEDELGVRSVGAPILNSEGVSVASISVVGTTGQIPLERVPALGLAVKTAAAEISARVQKMHAFA